MKTWRRSLLLLTVTSALLLTGCTGGGSSARSKLEAAQSVYRTMSGCTAQAEITADYGQRVYGYTVDLTVQGGSGVMTVKEPENLAGTVLTWSDGETKLAFDGTELDTGALSDSGLSPADAMPTILTACQGGEIVDCCMEEQAGAQVLHSTLDLDGDQGGQIQCWFQPDSYGLLRAELSQDGVTVVTMQFSDFSFTFPEGGVEDSGGSQ